MQECGGSWGGALFADDVASGGSAEQEWSGSGMSRIYEERSRFLWQHLEHCRGTSKERQRPGEGNWICSSGAGRVYLVTWARSGGDEGHKRWEADLLNQSPVLSSSRNTLLFVAPARSPGAELTRKVASGLRKKTTYASVRSESATGMPVRDRVLQTDHRSKNATLWGLD